MTSTFKTIYEVIALFPILTGKNCSGILSEQQHTMTRFPFRCELSLQDSPQAVVDVNDLFQIIPAFDHSTGTRVKHLCIHIYGNIIF